MADSNPSFNSFKVALASSDGINVDTHYGRAQKFFIYTVSEEDYDFVEERRVQPVCMEGFHDRAKMEESVALFTDCLYVVASRIGQGAASSLAARGINCMEIPGTIDDALLKIWKYNSIQNLFK